MPRALTENQEWVRKALVTGSDAPQALTVIELQQRVKAMSSKHSTYAFLVPESSIRRAIKTLISRGLCERAGITSNGAATWKATAKAMTEVQPGDTTD